MKWGDFPGVVGAVRAMFLDNGMPMESMDTLAMMDVPTQYRDLMGRAEGASIMLLGSTLDEFIPENQIDIDLADPKDDALDTFCNSEDSIQKLLVENCVGADALAEILDQAFDGDLHSIFLDDQATANQRERFNRATSGCRSCD